MNVLALSTSTPRGSVAIVSGDRVLAEVSHDDPRGHAEHLFSLVDEALARAQLARSDLDLVACDIGPGSFTGVRIAVASAKGIALGLDLPLAGVVSLEAMASEAMEQLGRGGEGAIVAAAIDAKKDELYLAVYEMVPGASPRERLSPVHVPVADAARRVSEAIGDRAFVSIADVPAFVDFACADGAAPPVRKLVACPSAGWIGRIAAGARRALGYGAARGPIETERYGAARGPIETERYGAARGPIETERYGAARGPIETEIVPLYVRAPDAVPSPSGTPGALAMLPAR